MLPACNQKKSMAMKKNNEFANFDTTMRKLISVPHAELKAALDAEKAAKKQKPQSAKKGKQ